MRESVGENSKVPRNDLFKSWLRQQFGGDLENNQLEFKSSKGGFPKSVWESYSSFANTEGGKIVLGVQEDKTTHQLSPSGLGQDLAFDFQKNFWDTVQNPSKVSRNLLSEKDVTIKVYKNIFVLVIDVPAARYSEKPIHLGLNPLKGTYKRHHDGDYLCTEDEVRLMMAEALPDEHPDNKILEGFSIEHDIDIISLKQYRNRLVSRDAFHPFLNMSDKEFLRIIKAYRTDRRTHKEGLTLAGLLMFGKIESLNDCYMIPSYFLDFRDASVESPDGRWGNRIYSDGTWHANLFQFFMRVYEYLVRDLPVPFFLEGEVRQADTSTHRAIREALINTLVHCDYTAKTHICIEKQREKYLFTNPGSLLISREQYYQGGLSVGRNPNILTMFSIIGLSERAGSGVSAILQGWRKARLRQPLLHQKAHPAQITLELPLLSIIPTEHAAKLRTLFGDEIAHQLDNNELRILAQCCIDGFVSNKALQTQLGVHASDISQLLRSLCDKSYLIKKGAARGSTYKLNESYKPTASKKNLELIGFKSRFSREELNRLIAKTCTDFISLRELSSMIKRDIRYLKNHVIPDLLDANILEREFPDTPNHALQRYRTNKAYFSVNKPH